MITDSARSGASPTWGATHTALRRKTTTAAEVTEIGTRLRVTLATGGVSLLTQGVDSGWILVAVAVFAPTSDQPDEQRE